MFFICERLLRKKTVRLVLMPSCAKAEDEIKFEGEILFMLKPPIFFKIRLIHKHSTAMICREACFIVL